MNEIKESDLEENEINENREKSKGNNEKIISKWMNLKSLLQIKKSIESSIDTLRKESFDKFIPNYCEIYKYELAMYLFSKETNRILFDKDYNPDNYKNIEISSDSKELCYDNCLIDFLFYFRENNSELIKIIELLPEENKEEFAYFLCNLFYDNFINEREGQNELILIIYLLLEKEIKDLSSPMEDAFLDNSFLDYFLRALIHKEEIKNYINFVIISEIEKFNETSFGYYSMDIIGLSRAHHKEYLKYKTKYSFFNMEGQNFYINETFKTMEKNIKKHSKKESFVIIDKIDTITTDEDSLNKPGFIAYENIPINSILSNEFFNEINNNFLKTLLFGEKDEFMKNFYIKQLKLSKNNESLFTCKDYYFETMVKEKIVSRSSIESFNKGYELIIQFLNDFLKKLEKTIIPYILKIICKLIYVLFKKKFPRITEFQLFILIGRFLFDKLFNPIFENIELINISEKDMISFETRKYLLDFASVFKKLMRGELFIGKQPGYYNIFNQFIITKYSRMKNIFQNFIDVKIPNNLQSLIEHFDDNNIKLNLSEINYNYFGKRFVDYIIHKCICFNLNHLLIFYNIVNNNKEKFIVEGSKLETIFNELSKYIPQMEPNNKYYVIVKEILNDEIKRLFEKEKKKSFKKQDILDKLKYQIITLLSEIQIKFNWNFINHYNTKELFDFIYKFLFEFEKKKKIVPLNWYAKYILKNLELIDEKYKKNDYKLLYESIIFDLVKLILQLRDLNSFLSIHINNKHSILENKKNELKIQYEGIKTNILKMKTILFIEKEKIDLCFMDGKKYKKLQKFMSNKNQESNINKDILIICEINHCPHSKIKEEKPDKFFSYDEINLCHIHKPKEFASKFSSYTSLISDEIIDHSINQRTEDRPSILSSSKIDINNNILFSDSSKETLHTFMNYINRIIQTSTILKSFQTNEEREKISKCILDYILKALCIKIYEKEPLSLDITFNNKCAVLKSFVEPIQFKIPEEFGDNNILKDIIYYFEKIEKHRIPSAMYKEIGIVIDLISSMYKFYFDRNQNDFDDLLNTIIYCLILTKPKRMIFNIYFCKYFLMNNDITGNAAFNINQIESAITIINKINGQYLNLSDEEFNEKCSKYKIS